MYRDTSMSSPDILAILKELKILEGGIIDNVYQCEKLIGLKIRSPGGNRLLLIEPSIRIHFTNAVINWRATNFVLMIRKHINNKVIEAVRQYRFDRIVEIQLADGYRIIAEIIPRGNFIVARDDKILFALEHVHMRDRSIYPGAHFKYPPQSPEDPRKIPFESFQEKIMSGKTTLHGLLKIGIGKKYALEACFRAGIDCNEKPTELSRENLKAIYETVRNILDEICENILSPRVYFRDDKVVAFAPIKLHFFETNEYEVKKFQNFSDALDFFFPRLYAEKPETEFLAMLRRERKKLLGRIKAQKERIDELKKEEERAKRIAEKIYENLRILQQIHDTIKRARLEKKLEWDEILKRIENGKKKGIKEALMIEKISRDGRIFVKLNSEVIVLDIRKDLHEIAEEYYKKAKKTREKISTAEKELKKSLEELERLEEKIRKQLEEERIIIKARPKQWYDSFYWFISSDGFLVVAGKDASSNERLVRKYLDKNDLFLHAEIHGGSAVIIKNPKGVEIPERTILEAAIFAAARSKAWNKGLTAVDVFWTPSDKVSLTPPSGMYRPTGAFIIREKNYLRNVSLKLAIGIKVERVNDEVIVDILSGPPDAISRETDLYVILVPGDWKKSAIARKIIEKLSRKAENDPVKLKAIKSVKVERIIDLIPGPSKILENGDEKDE